MVTPYVKPAATAEILANCCSSLIFDRGPEGNGRPTGKNVRSEAAASWESDRDASTPRAPHRGEVTGGQPGGPLRAGRYTVKGPRRGAGPASDARWLASGARSLAYLGKGARAAVQFRQHLLVFRSAYGVELSLLVFLVSLSVDRRTPVMFRSRGFFPARSPAWPLEILYFSGFFDREKNARARARERERERRDERQPRPAGERGSGERSWSGSMTVPSRRDGSRRGRTLGEARQGGRGPSRAKEGGGRSFVGGGEREGKGAGAKGGGGS